MEKKEVIIATNFIENDDEWHDGYEEFLEINGLDESSLSLDEYISTTLDEYLKDEIVNLDVCCGDIIAIADLGFWNGRMSGYQIIKKERVNGIFDVITNEIQNYKFYCDNKNVRATLHHHDGTHYILFREIKDGADIEKITKLLYNNEEVSPKLIRNLTMSLRPYVKKIYGFK